MEVSSQSLKYNRVYGIHFLYAIWTNIAPEHIGKNEHNNYEDYLNSKLKIFDQSEDAVINVNTNNLDDIMNRCKKNKNGVIVVRDDMDFKYVRIQGKELAENTHYPKGIFSMCMQLIQDGVMEEEDKDLFLEINDWFSHVLPYPPQCRNQEKVVCFFKTENTDLRRINNGNG